MTHQSHKTNQVWFAIPSASVERCRERLPAWRELGYKVAILQNRERGDVPADITVWSDTYPGWAESVNILCRDIVPASASIVVSGGDDMLPDPNHTAQQLAAQFHQRFPDTFGVMQPAGDTYMWAANYCGSPWIGRAFFQSMYNGRGAMHGGYRHNWADYELYWVSRCINALWMRDDIAQHHAHHTREDQQPPEWWTANVADKDRQDCELFLARKYRFFPGHQPINRDAPFDQQDLLTNECGLGEWKWNNTYAPHATQNQPSTRIESALADLAKRNLHRVAIYGAGTHTQRAATALASPPVNITGIIDDNPASQGTRLWNYPIITMAAALESRPDAIVISSDSHERTMWDNTAIARERGIEVVRLYTQHQPEQHTGEAA